MIFRMVSKLSGFFQMIAKFPDAFKTVRIYIVLKPEDIHYVIFPLSFFEHNDCPLRGGGTPQFR